MPAWAAPPRRHTSRYPREHVRDSFPSPPPSGPTSDDEDVEYVRGGATRSRPGYRQKALDKPFSRKIDRARNPVRSDAYGDDSTSQYSSTTGLSRFERHPEGRNASLSPSRLEDSGGVCVTTMDEDDQQMFIALFYWRRKVIEAHFSAWKWVVFSLPQSAKQIHRHGMSIRRSKPIAAGYGSMGLRPPRRNLILKRHTGLSSAEESEKNDSGAEFEEPVVPTKPSLHGIGSKGFKRNSSLLVNKASENAQSTGKRRQFRAELCLVFSCFRQWKSNADASRRRRVHQLVQAAHFQRAQELKNALRAWKAGSKLLELKRKRLENADQFHWNCAKRNVFREWKRYCRVEREIARRQTLHAVRQKRLAFQRWCQCILQTRLCRKLAEKRCYNHLRIVFRSLREGLLEVKRERLKYALAISHYQKQLQVSMLHLWREAIFQDPFYLLSIDRGTRIGLLIGVRKWRRFMVERQTRARKVLLADFFRYRLSLRRALRGWIQFIEWRQRRKLLHDEVRRHYERNLKMHSVQKLRVTANRNRSSRDQVRLATKWHQRKVATRSFELWVANARKIARVNLFRRDVHARVVSNVFRGWRNQIATRRRLRAKQCIVSERWNGQIMRRSMARWMRTQHVHSFITSLKLKRRNVNTAMHFRAWQSWSKGKIYWRNIVELQRIRTQETLQQRVISQWFNVTLRTRCVNRLVKLFRKKRSRNRVKAIFRLWRVHAYVCIATRKRDLDRAQLSLVEWKRVCRGCKENRIMTAVAAQYYSERRYAIAIKLWSSFVKRSSRSRRAEGKALSIYFRRIMIRSLQHWYIAARRLRRQAEFLAYRQQVRDDKAMTRCLQAWLTLVRQQIQRRTQEWTALQFQMESLQQRSFYAWVQLPNARRASSKKLSFAVVTHKNNLLGKVLRAWRLSTRRSTELKGTCAFIQKEVKQRRLQSSVAQWSNFCLERQRCRKQTAMADKFYRGYLMCLAMYHWQEKWSQASTLRHKEIMVSRLNNARRLAKAVFRWHENYQHSSRARAKTTKASQFYTKKVLATRFELWKRHQDAVRRKVSKRRFATRLRQQKLVSRMFHKWQRFVKTSAFESVQGHKADHRRVTFVLRRTFQRWKGYRRKRTLYIIAYTYRRKILLQKVWFGWKQHREYAAKVRQNILVTNQLLRNNLFRATFIRWKTFTSHRRQWHVQTSRADDHYTLWICKRAVARLRKRANFHQAVVKAASFGRINGARFFWRRWRHFIIIKRKIRRRRMLAEQTHLQNRRRRHFCAWKMLTKRCVQVRRDKSDALYRISCLRMVWVRWNGAVTWRRHLTATEYRRLDNLQTTLLRTWRARVQHRLNQRAKAAKAVAFQKAKLREKAWKSWLRYITYCHEKQKQMVWVLSYYSVEVLLRRSLAAWKEMVGMKQMQREHDALAASYSSHRLIREGYREWREYVSRRRLKVERLEGILHTSELLALSRSIRKWRSRAVVLRRQHLNPVLAAQFYSRRRLTCGLNKLVKWKTSQKSTRELTLQAKRFGDEKAVAACFRCWQRYHQWRVRYAHLTQVFQRNQKGDVLARWKRYWWKRQSINEKLLQARVFHCIRVEQKMLTAWRNFVHTRKHKKVAIAFNRATVLQETFTIWKRRVHVLRQMRKMFICQASFRAQTHFGAWKRFVVARKQMNERLRGAMKFNDKLRRLDVWQKWRAWVSMQGQERATIELAVEFRQRFFTRKTFSVWKRRAANWNFQRALTDQALLQWRISLLRRGFQLFAGWRQSKAKLARLQRELATQLVKKRKRHAVATLRALCVESDRKRGLMKQSCHHWQLCHQQKYWGRIMQWFGVAKWHKLQRAQADAFARTHLLRRCVVALEAHICRTKQLKTTVDAFRCRYFRSVADNCFYQWKSFTAFKLKLRVFRRKTQQMQRRQRLLHWRHIAVEQERRHSGMLQIAVRRRHRQLVAWFNHWESVCTDQWVEKELVAHHQRHAQKQRRLRGAVQALKAQLPARRERHKCKSFFLQRHKSFLLQVFQHWRHAAEITRPLQHVTCEQNV